MEARGGVWDRDGRTLGVYRQPYLKMGDALKCQFVDFFLP